MRYALLLHYQEMTEAELGEEMMEEGKAAFHAYAESLDRAGILISAEVLQPSTSSTTVRVENGTTRVQDGPFADTKEQLAGTFVIDVPDLDVALAWAAKCPAAQWGVIEVRPSFVRFEKGTWVESS